MTTWYGSFLLSDGETVERRLFAQDPTVIADRLLTIRSGGVLEEEAALAQAAPEGLVVHARRLRGLGAPQLVAPVPRPPFDPAGSGYPSTLLRQALLKVAVRETHVHMSERDRLIVQEVRALDEIIKSVNLLSERLREWYALHAPEVVGAVREHGDLARLVATHGSRDAVMEAVEGLKASELGVDLPAADEAIVRGFAAGLATMYETWAQIESRLEDAMHEVAPATATVAGPMLGARLISHAGGLTDLALAPSGTVQTYGAENALFRHLKDGSPPPKHGVIYQHEAVNRSPWWQRGKIARALAGKISIAAKSDAFGGPPGRGPELLAAFEERLAEIQRKHERPPEKRPRGAGAGGRAPGGRGPGPGRAGGGRGKGRGGGGRR